MNDLINIVSLEELQDARAVMFTHAIGVLFENDNLENRSPSDFRHKQRRGKKAIANTVMDIVHLFKYLCNGNGEFPTGVLVNNTLPNTPVENAPDSSPIPTPLYDLIALPPSSQDLQCGQPDPGVSSAGLTSARSSSHIGSPFLADEEPMVSRPSVRQSSPRQPINQSFSDKSVVISEDSMISDTDGTPLTRCPPAVCCDHSRAILDLRCTVDTMQHQMIELQRQLDAYGKDKFAGTPVPSPCTDAVQYADITRPSYVEDILPSPPDSQSPSMDSTDLNQSLSSDSCNLSSILNIATPTKNSHSNMTHIICLFSMPCWTSIKHSNRHSIYATSILNRPSILSIDMYSSLSYCLKVSPRKYSLYCEIYSAKQRAGLNGIQRSASSSIICAVYYKAAL